jgi:hypothetical protein
MNRTTVIYILTAVAFIAGLWGVLRIGSTLRAPMDLSGEWAISLQPLDPLALDEKRKMVVAQSGRFIRAVVRDAHGREIALAGQLDPPAVGGSAGSLRLESRDGSWKLEGLVSADGLEIRGRASQQWSWSARRTGDVDDPLAVAGGAAPAARGPSSRAPAAPVAGDAERTASAAGADAGTASAAIPSTPTTSLPAAAVIDERTAAIDGDAGPEPGTPPTPPAQ